MNDQDGGTAPEPGTGEQPVLFVVKGDATAEEIAALVVAIHSVAAAQSAQTEAPPERPRSEWSAHHRKVRASYPPGPGGWRSSAIPR